MSGSRRAVKEGQAPGEETKDRIHPRNQLNDLTGTEWIKFTRTWFVCDSPRYWKNKNTEMHPARYPEELVADFVRFFTKPGGWVLDPFAGSGATLVASRETGRNALGVEINSKYVATMRQRLSALPLFEESALPVLGNAAHLRESVFWAQDELQSLPLPRDESGLPQFDFIMTSPPYWSMLRKSRGGVESKQKQRGKQGLDTHYSDSLADLGNIEDYEEFIERLGLVFEGLRPLLKPQGYMTIVVQNLRAPDGEIKPLAWDLTRRLSTMYQFQGERLWCQNTKPLGIWGYPKTFVPNYHHHYCLIFRRVE